RDRGLDEQSVWGDRERVDGAVRSRGRQGSAPEGHRVGRGPGLVGGDDRSGPWDGRRGRAARCGDGGGGRLAREPLLTLVDAALESLAATWLRGRRRAVAHKAFAGPPTGSAVYRLRFGG